MYDVTSYVDEHPGGASILKNAGCAHAPAPQRRPFGALARCGGSLARAATLVCRKDSTAGFHGPQHPTRVFDIIDDFLIGTLVESDKDK